MEASKIKGASIECYKDHRIAMSFAVLGVRVPGIVVTDKECVDKTYPEFWMDLEQRFKINLEAHSVPRKLPDKKSAAAASAGTSCESQRSVLITGMRGSGKTHMGTALAHKLGRQFFDLDAVFESKHGPIAVFVQRKVTVQIHSVLESGCKLHSGLEGFQGEGSGRARRSSLGQSEGRSHLDRRRSGGDRPGSRSPATVAWTSHSVDAPHRGTTLFEGLSHLCILPTRAGCRCIPKQRYFSTVPGRRSKRSLE